MSAPGSKNFTSSRPPDMRSMSLEKRTPEAPRCGSWLPNALCIFQRTRSWAVASVIAAAKPKAATHSADAATSASFGIRIDMSPPPRLAAEAQRARSALFAPRSARRHRDGTIDRSLLSLLRCSLFMAADDGTDGRLRSPNPASVAWRSTSVKTELNGVHHSGRLPRTLNSRLHALQKPDRQPRHRRHDDRADEQRPQIGPHARNRVVRVHIADRARGEEPDP